MLILITPLLLKRKVWHINLKNVYLSGEERKQIKGIIISKEHKKILRGKMVLQLGLQGLATSEAHP